MFSYFGNITKPLYMLDTNVNDDNYVEENMWTYIMKISQKPKAKYTKLLNIKRIKKIE